VDGDVDFGPDSVRMLTDRMKKDKKVGAVSSRIHPIGSGPLIWYQVSHDCSIDWHQ
jgi:chitin synthase